MHNEENDMRDGKLLQVVTFKIENEEFGVNILQVQEINKMMSITKIPNAPFFIEGVINLRGKIIPIVNLRKKLGFETKPHDKATRIIIINLDALTLGFVVDCVSEVLTVPDNIIDQAPSMAGGIESEYIEGVGKFDDRLLILLELRKVFVGNEKEEIEQII